MRRMTVMRWLSALGLLLAIVTGQAARASTLPGPTVLYSNSWLTSGNSAESTALQVPAAGELFVTLTDLAFPDSYTSLDLSLTDGTSTLESLPNPGELTLDLTQPSTLYADVFGEVTGEGLYNLTATFLPSAPVPLPASCWLLASALMGLVWCAQRRARSAG